MRTLPRRLPDPHPLADQHRVHALAVGVDSARAVLVGHLAAGGRPGGAPALPVGRSPHRGEVLRDRVALAQLRLGVKALGSNPRKSAKDGVGEQDVPVVIEGTTFVPGRTVWADEDGVLVEG